MAGNRTRVNCMEGSYAYHYTTIAYVRHFSETATLTSLKLVMLHFLIIIVEFYICIINMQTRVFPACVYYIRRCS